MENKWKELEQNPSYIFDNVYLDHKNKLEQMYEEKANGVKVRTKCVCYEFGKKSSKFFLNLEKQLNQVPKSSLNSSLQWRTWMLL